MPGGHDSSCTEPGNGAELDRREFLRRSSWLLGCVGLSQLGVLQALAASQAGVESPDSFLTRVEADVFTHLIRAALPVEGTNLPSPEEVNVIQTLDKVLLAGMEPHVLLELKEGIAFFQQGPKAAFNGNTFTQLSLDEARLFCDQWAGGDVPEKRGIVMGLKKLVGLSYWSNPITWPHLGYVGPISKRNNIPALGNTPMPT